MTRTLASTTQDTLRDAAIRIKNRRVPDGSPSVGESSALTEKLGGAVKELTAFDPS
jgi:hypothetical protein